MQIREEQPADHALIHELTRIAFEPMTYSDGTEPAIIDQLRASGDLTLSLVAETDSEVVGHVAFSPVVIGRLIHGWYGLGPVCVHPDLQRKGIGMALIQQGLATIRKLPADGCALIGDPDYYSRFGFVADGSVHYQQVPDRNVQWISFGDVRPAGELVYRPAFGS